MNGASLAGQPILILPEGTLRQTGKDAQKKNIAAAKVIADSIRTTLGPRGMDKMLVSSIGDVTITNDGVTILDEMEIEHPAAKMMVEIAKTQEEEVGDGTTTAVVLAGELLKKSEELLDQNIHPILIAKGFKMASTKALEILDEIGNKIDINDDEGMEKIAMTAMTGKSGETAKESLAKIAVQAIKMVSENGREKINKDDIKIEKKQGGSIDETELIKGLVIDKEVVHSGMPKRVKDAKILLIDMALEVKSTETDAKIEITSPDQMQGFLDQESKMLKEMANKIIKTGCSVVFCQKGIDDIVQHYLAKSKILAARRVKESDMSKLAKATGATIVTNIDEITEDDLGFAGIVEEKKIAGEEMIFVKECKNPKAVSILIRGGTEHVVDEAKRAMEDAVLGVISTIELGKVVVGGGAIEIELAKKLREYADSVGGREQLAINKFAEAVEIIPRTLAESAGMDSIDVLVELVAEHEKGNQYAGIDVIRGKISDMKELGVLEPLKIKTQAIKSASEAAEMILRIDDVVTAGKSKSMPSGPGAGMQPGGMPEY
ncbi:MAG: TCP-1/cpn60 chaperonin family protein [Candidatus Aenigmarchaeota archaeon]|nr:TCP-1/cpn60 chaperonin family protein [Candidatus Aenigmarchaeota archaeon]